MFSSGGDSLVQRLHISRDIFRKVSHQQVRYLNDLLDRPFPALLEAVSKFPSEKLTSELGYYGIPLHAGEYPFSSLEQFLQDIVPNWSRSSGERMRVLRAISRNEATQIVSIPLFIGLWRGLEHNKQSSEPSQTELAVNRSRQIVEMRFIDVHFIYALIGNRLPSVIQKEVLFMRWEELRRAMTNVDIRLSENVFLIFQKSLVDSGIYLPCPENKVNLYVLLRVAEYFRNREEQVAIPPAVEEEHSSTPSSAIRCINALTPKWLHVMERLSEGQGSQRTMVSYDRFVRAVKDVGGTVMSSRDLLDFWVYLVKHSDATPRLDTAGSVNFSDVALPLSAIDAVMSPPESNYSSLSALMRDEYHPHVAKLYADNPNKQDHLTSLLISPAVASTEHYSPNMRTMNSFPWQKNEADAVSNVKIRVLSGLKRAGADKQTAFAHALFSSERKFDNTALPRGVLLEAFASAGIHLNRSDAQDIWEEANCTLPAPLKAKDLLRWLELGHVQPPPMQDTTASPNGRQNGTRKGSSLAELAGVQNKRFVTHHAPAWASPRSDIAVSRSGYDDHYTPGRDAPPSDSLPNYSPSYDLGVTGDSLVPDSVSADISDRADSVPSIDVIEAMEVILRNRARLAYEFRTLGMGSGIVKSSSLIPLLRKTPYCIQLIESDMAVLLSKMAGCSEPEDPFTVYLRFNDSIANLEVEVQKYRSANLDSKIQGIQRKLELSRQICGNRDSLCGHAQLLRQRLKNSRQRGHVVTWDGVPDVCSPHEFMTLMNSIDVHFTLEETELIYNRLRLQSLQAKRHCGYDNDAESIGCQIEHGFSLGDAIAFLASLL
mmetsp:Transcript_3919/g.6149  ORF Transcript_3919/g.6149 Transcript_3919/m.6149 type:complete len:828 (+) Transcript_3919:99-2582(+)